MDDPNQAGMAAGGALPTQSESPNPQPQGHEEPHGAELVLNQGMNLRPAAELPTEEVYDTLQDLMEAVNAYGVRTGCDLVKRAHKTTAKGQPAYRWMMLCARFGSTVSTATVRNTKSKKCQCPFGFWCIALDRMNPTTSQYRIALSDGRRQHNHDPQPITALPNARRRARRQPDVEARREQLNTRQPRREGAPESSTRREFFQPELTDGNWNRPVRASNRRSIQATHTVSNQKKLTQMEQLEVLVQQQCETMQQQRETMQQQRETMQQQRDTMQQQREIMRQMQQMQHQQQQLTLLQPQPQPQAPQAYYPPTAQWHPH